MGSFQPHLKRSKSRVQLLFDGLQKISYHAFTAKHALHFTNDFMTFEACLEVPLATTDQSLQQYKAKYYNLSNTNLILHFVLVIHSIKNVQSLSHIHIYFKNFLLSFCRYFSSPIATHMSRPSHSPRSDHRSGIY